MPVPESSVMSPEVEITDPEWSNCLPAQRHLEAMVKYHAGKLSLVELDILGEAMVAHWQKLDGQDARKKK